MSSLPASWAHHSETFDEILAGPNAPDTPAEHPQPLTFAWHTRAELPPTRHRKKVRSA